MKHESKTWYSCDRCGCEIKRLPRNESVVMRGKRADGTEIDEIVPTLVASREKHDEQTVEVECFYWKKIETTQLCRSCFKEYKKLLADFLKSEK